jgi:hypothetical protein
VNVSIVEGYPYAPQVTATLVGHAHCSTDTQDLTAQHDQLDEHRVTEDRIHRHSPANLPTPRPGAVDVTTSGTEPGSLFRSYSTRTP